METARTRASSQRWSEWWVRRVYHQNSPDACEPKRSFSGRAGFGWTTMRNLTSAQERTLAVLSVARLQAPPALHHLLVSGSPALPRPLSPGPPSLLSLPPRHPSSRTGCPCPGPQREEKRQGAASRLGHPICVTPTFSPRRLPEQLCRAELKSARETAGEPRDVDSSAPGCR